MNSSYGKLLEAVSKYTDTKIAKFEDIKSTWLKSLIVDAHPLGDGEYEVMELVTRKRKIKDDKLTHVGNAVLQWSKLILVEFIYWMEEMLIEGSYKICYLGN
jgi:hypothetical protein